MLVLLAWCNASRRRVRPADPLKPGLDLAVIRMVTTLQMNSNMPMWMPFRPTRNDAGLPAPQERRLVTLALTTAAVLGHALVLLILDKYTSHAGPPARDVGPLTDERPRV